jgi:hypothetical protein
MFSKSRSTSSAASTQPESRTKKREPMLGVTVMIRSATGVVHEGVVLDVSDGGVGVSGDTTGFHSGDKIELVLNIQGERVGYFGDIRHIDAANRTYGVHFESGPFRGDVQREFTKQCKACRKDYPDEHKFCFRCGQRLVGGSRPAPINPAARSLPA